MSPCKYTNLRRKMLKIIKKADIILLVLLLALGLFLTFAISGTSSAGQKVVVTLDGKEYGTYSLAVDKEILVQNGNNINKITIKNGQVQMAESSCKNQLCVKHHTISQTNQRIVCLPNRVMVEIEGGKDGKFDAISS